MKRFALGLPAALALAACGRYESILYSPRQTPESWLRLQPYIEFRWAGAAHIFVQPTTSAIVYLLGLVAIGAGWRFWHGRGQHQSRRWWAAALVLWGLGAWLAGTSYEAFSYAIKCAGREACAWTSAWELGYLVLSVASLDAMLVAQAYASASGTWRRRLVRYAAGNLAVYLAAVALGALLPVAFLISFELLLVFCAPNVLIFIGLNLRRQRAGGSALDRALLAAWAWLILTIGAYFVYLLSGLTQSLWARGWWFSENDVLHIGLIIWMVYLALRVAPLMEDSRG